MNTMKTKPSKLLLVTLLVLAGAVEPSAGIAADRVALVIGNSTYTQIGRLLNPENDAVDMTAALRRLGFQVTTEFDTDRVQLTRALRAFTRRSAGADVSLVFYAGHGIEMDGVNYLVPVDARLERDTEVRYETVTLNDLLTSTLGASLRVVILDACRNNPLARSMQRTRATRGLAISGSFGKLDESLLADETLVAYAAAAGTTAADGRGRNSPYTSALLSHLERPLEILTLFRRVRAEVLDSTNGRQRPHEYQSLLRDHYLGPTPAITSATPKSLGLAGIEVDSLPMNLRELNVTGLRELAEDGNAGAQTELGERYNSGSTGVDRNYTEAVVWFQRAAEQGFPPAQAAVGRAYYYGQGVPQDNRAALTWYRLAAEQGYAPAQFRLGSVHANGVGEVRRNDEEAARWYSLAADQGYAAAQHNLGVMYLDGRGRPQDSVAAVRWIRRAADLGEPNAQMALGYMYEVGRIVGRDLAEAAEWYRLAANQGHADAQTRLNRLR